jgi:hypothetical protein
MSTSRDGGQTWSAPVIVLDPALTTARFAAIAVKAPGTVAIAYLGSADGTKFDGYVAETTNAFDASPTFWSSAVSAPDDPLYPDGFVSGYDLSYFDNGGDGVEFVQVKYAPSGDVWASFVKDMCKNPTNSCRSLSEATRRRRGPETRIGRRGAEGAEDWARDERGPFERRVADAVAVGVRALAAARLAPRVPTVHRTTPFAPRSSTKTSAPLCALCGHSSLERV